LHYVSRGRELDPSLRSIAVTSRIQSPEPTITPEATPDATGNARITGTSGAVIFVLLFVEGLTLLRVRALISTHVFVGMLLVPFVVVKIASTTYRFARYYSGRRDYVDKGAPHVVLRLLGPLVTITTIAVFATGIAALKVGGHFLVQAHKLSFVAWFVVMAIHVLGHILETPALAFADWRRSTRGQAAGANARFAVLATTLAIGIVLAVASLSWVHTAR
jgi:hypothetical protein